MNKIAVKYQMQGRFKLEATKRDGSKRVVADWFDNLILNAGLDRIGTNQPINGAIVGTGNTAPSNTQTSLVAQIAYSSTLQGSVSYGADGTDNYAWMRRTYRFAEGVATGNLSEVGVGWSSGNCFSRALILDGGGSPTTITILSDETLDVTYELRIYPSITDVTGSLTLNAISYNYTLRLSNLNSSDAAAFFGFASSASGMGNTVSAVSGSLARTGTGSLGDIYSSPGGSGSIGPGTVTALSYTSSSYNRTLRYTWGLANGSASFYIFRFWTAMGYYKAQFTPEIPKTSANILSLDLTITWARRP